MQVLDSETPVELVQLNPSIVIDIGPAVLSQGEHLVVVKKCPPDDILPQVYLQHRNLLSPVHQARVPHGGMQKED